MISLTADTVRVLLEAALESANVFLPDDEPGLAVLATKDGAPFIAVVRSERDQHALDDRLWQQGGTQLAAVEVGVHIPAWVDADRADARARVWSEHVYEHLDEWTAVLTRQAGDLLAFLARQSAEHSIVTIEMPGGVTIRAPKGVLGG